jgi:hypothetical protein
VHGNALRADIVIHKSLEHILCLRHGKLGRDSITAEQHAPTDDGLAAGHRWILRTMSGSSTAASHAWL